MNRTQPSTKLVLPFGSVSCRIEADFSLSTAVESRWILPNGMFLRVNENDEKYNVVRQGESTADTYETQLLIQQLSYSDANTYTCEVRDVRDPDDSGPWLTYEATLQLLGIHKNNVECRHRAIPIE